MGLVIRLCLIFFFNCWAIGVCAAPLVILKDIQGKEHVVGDFAGKVTLVHFWATWCVPCRHELPQLINVARGHADKDLQLILIAADNHDDVKAYIKKHKIKAQVLIDQYGTALRQYQVKGLPYTSIIDHTGIIAATEQGVRDWRSSTMTERLETLLNKARMASRELN